MLQQVPQQSRCCVHLDGLSNDVHSCATAHLTSVRPALEQETFGAMAKTEKVHFILEQVQLSPSWPTCPSGPAWTMWCLTGAFRGDQVGVEALPQVRLCLARRDFVRAQILIRKVRSSLTLRATGAM